MFAASKTDSASTGGYQISRSLRFNTPDTANLTRTPASAGNRRTWTWSGWIKRAQLTASNYAFYTPNGNTDATWTSLLLSNSDTFIVEAWTYNYFVSSGVYRDPSAWYHFVVAFDTTQATNTNRVKVYVNGQDAAGTYTYPAQNFDGGMNSAVLTRLGNLGGYMTEVNFIDGTQLTPSSFGETNAQTGVWQPKAYSGSYGTNGFYLNFSDNSNTTAATLGKDYSGNGNNWTPNNFSVTAGAGNDSLVDSPTSYGTDTGVGGSVRGNYATLNPLDKGTPSAGTLTLSNGNLDIAYYAAAAVGVWSSTRSTMGMSSGQWYWEITATNVTSAFNMFVGVATSAATLSQFIGYDAYGWGYYSVNGNKRNNNSPVAYGESWTTGDIIGIAFDADTATLTFYKNGTSQGVAYSSMGAGTYFPAVSTNADNGTTTATMNFGQRPFAYTAPSGFKALCTQNLPTPTIGATSATLATKYFNPVLWTGNGASSRAITGVGFQPDWVWDKMRSAGYQHAIVDSVRGGNQVLHSNSTSAEDTNWQYGYVSSFDSDGFTIQAGSTSAENWNLNAATFVAWCWKANGTGSTNTAGSITSTVSANTTSGFSIVTYTGTGANATVGHGLGVAPSMVIIKARSFTQVWVVGHSSIGFGNYLLLNATDASASGSNVFNSTAPTSTVFSLGSGGGGNQSAATYVAYCFAPIAGYSAFGSYTGNGSTDGPFVYCGFRPAYLMFKRTDSTSGWTIYDASRDPYNYARNRLYANNSDAEGSGANYTDLLSNGFKVRDTDIWGNANGGTYIYMAFASNPFKTSLAR